MMSQGFRQSINETLTIVYRLIYKMFQKILFVLVIYVGQICTHLFPTVCLCNRKMSLRLVCICICFEVCYIDKLF